MLDDATSGEQLQHKNHGRDDEEQMYPPAKRSAADEPNEPQHEKDRKDSPKHFSPPVSAHSVRPHHTLVQLACQTENPVFVLRFDTIRIEVRAGARTDPVQ